MKVLKLALVSFAIMAALSACDRSTEKTSPPTASRAALTKTTIQLNWKPEPQFGGFFTAQENGAYKKHGLEVTVAAGGTGTPTIQMVGAGTVDFAVVSADELILARQAGNDVIALFAVYQTCPQGIMVHAERGFNDIGDIFKNEGTVAMQRGLPYADFLEQKYGFDKVKIVPSPGGDLSAFRSDPNFSMQCFVTSEPIAAKKAGLDVKSFLIADAGYNPYTTVLVTRTKVWKDKPDLVKRVVAAVREGWTAYLDNPALTNAAMQKLNPSMDAETFAASAEVQKPLIENKDTAEHGLGSMTAERWGELSKQLVELKVVDKAVDPATCFVNLK